MEDITVRRRAQSKHLRLRVQPDGRVVVSAPMWIRLERIEFFVRQHSEWIAKALERLRSHPKAYSPLGTKEEYLQHRERSHALACERVSHFNAQLGFAFAKIVIRNQRSCWGSCSRRGTLSFNYKIALLPPELADYIIVHELCHLKEFNHSPAFWKLVAKTIPDYKKIKKEFKKIHLTMR